MMPHAGFETPKGKSLWGRQSTAGKPTADRRLGKVCLSKGQLLTMQRRQVACTAAKPVRQADSGRPQAEADQSSNHLSKLAWPPKFNNTDIRMQKTQVDSQALDESKNDSLDVFERLFRSAAREKNRIVVRAKENIARKAKENTAGAGTERKQVEKGLSILKENKRLINNTKNEIMEGKVILPSTSLVHLR